MKRAVFITLILLLTACTQAPVEPPTGVVDNSSEPASIVAGYPLDRSMEALAAQQGIDEIVVVAHVKVQPAVSVGRFDAKDPSSGVAISTPATADVQRSLVSQGLQGQIELIFGGGTVGDRTVNAGDEVSPPLEKVEEAQQLLVAGRWVDVPGVGRCLEPWFVYELDASGNAVSLLRGAGPESYPRFAMADLEAALTSRPQ
jgi:hypothetical protein